MGSWKAALAFFAYAASFSFAYTSLPAGTGALLLFGAVQASMIGWGLFRGELFGARQIAGLLLASCGLLGLLWPGLSAPPPLGAMLMAAAGISWGIYSLLGKGTGDPLHATAGNFVRAAVPALMLSAICLGRAHIDGKGALLALASGALTSGLGYAIWYSALPHLKASQAPTAQPSSAQLSSAQRAGDSRLRCRSVPRGDSEPAACLGIHGSAGWYRRGHPSWQGCQAEGIQRLMGLSGLGR